MGLLASFLLTWVLAGFTAVLRLATGPSTPAVVLATAACVLVASPTVIIAARRASVGGSNSGMHPGFVAVNSVSAVAFAMVFGFAG